MIPKYESLTVEFKEKWDEKKDGAPIKKTIVAFANTAGGDLFIGVSDSGEIVGLESPDQIEEKLASTVRDTISPSLAGFISTERINIDGKNIVKVHVDRGWLRPYCLDPKTASGVYVRIGNTSSPASIDDIARMVRDSNPIPYEERISIEQNLTFNYFSRFCAERGLEIDPKINLTFGLWNNKLQAYTNLAYICSDQSDTAVVMINFADNDKMEIIDSDRVVGSIFKLYEEVTSFVAKSNYAWLEKPSQPNAERIDHYFVDPRVILEATVNMLAHRDYSKKPANLVHITPDSIQLTSVGGLVDGLSIEDIAERMATECRNKKLAMLFNMLKLMESRGSGFRRIRNSYKTKSIEELLSVSETSFTITLPRQLSNTFIERQDFKQILDFVGTRKEVTRRSVQDYLQMSQSATVNTLREMVKANLLEVIGNGPATRYRIKNS